jgi:hypothetical protein
MSISKIVFLDNYNLSVFSSAYKRSPDLVFPLTNYQRSLEKGFILVIPDDYITLISSDIVSTKKKLSVKMIQSYLTGFLPEDMIEQSYGYIKPAAGNITIIAYSNKMREFCIDYQWIIRHAVMILTPSIIALLASKDCLILESNNMFFYKNGLDILHLSGTITDLPNAADIAIYKLDSGNIEQILKWMEHLPSTNLLKKTIFHNLILIPQIKTAHHPSLNKANIFWTIIFIVFAGTLYFIKILPMQRDIWTIQSDITKTYAQVGINNLKNNAPIDALQYKIVRLQDIDKIRFNPIEIHNKLELALDENNIIESFKLNCNILELKISSKNAKTFETLSSNITRIFGLKFKVISSEIKDERYKYAISLDLNQIPSDNIMEP